jgi:hypothetical protein
MNYAPVKSMDGHCKTPPRLGLPPKLGISRTGRVAQRSGVESGAKRLGSVGRCAWKSGLECGNTRS